MDLRANSVDQKGAETSAAHCPHRSNRMKATAILIPIIAVLCCAPAAMAQESLLDYVKNSCQDDLGEHCKGVTPGEGRLALCLAAHEDQISERCQYALYRGAVALEQAIAAISYIARSCSGDAEKLCPETTPGDGRILECLESKSDKVSSGCKEAVKDVTGD
jgi:Golgi apparatus protein 1